MNRPKRHHFVPQMLLRRFTDENGLLHVFDKRIREKRVVSSRPTNVFLKNELYTQHGEGGIKDVSAEAMFANLENEANLIIERIVAAVRNKKTPALTKSEKETWDNFLFYQWKRVPGVHDKTLSHAEFDALQEDIIENYKLTVGPLTAGERERMNDPTNRDRIGQNAKV